MRQSWLAHFFGGNTMKKLLILLLALIVLDTGAFLIACDEETPDDEGNS